MKLVLRLMKNSSVGSVSFNKKYTRTVRQT